MQRSTIKDDFMHACVPAMQQAAVSGSPTSVAVPQSISCETARNYAYEVRKKLSLAERVGVTYDTHAIYFRATNQGLFDDAYVAPPVMAAAYAERNEKIDAAISAKKRAGVAVLTGKPTEPVLRACATLLDHMALDAVEMLGTNPADLELLVKQHGLTCIVSKCQGGALLT